MGTVRVLSPLMPPRRLPPPPRLPPADPDGRDVDLRDPPVLFLELALFREPVLFREAALFRDAALLFRPLVLRAALFRAPPRALLFLAPPVLLRPPALFRALLLREPLDLRALLLREPLDLRLRDPPLPPPPREDSPASERSSFIVRPISSAPRKSPDSLMCSY
jgi:hypothetical protein